MQTDYHTYYPVIAPLLMCFGVGDGKTTACVMAQAATIDALRKGQTLEKPTDEMECCCPILRRLAIRANDINWWESDEERTEHLRPLIPLLLDSKLSDNKLMEKRIYHIADQIVRVLTPMRLRFCKWKEEEIVSIENLPKIENSETLVSTKKFLCELRDAAYAAAADAAADAAAYAYAYAAAADAAAYAYAYAAAAADAADAAAYAAAYAYAYAAAAAAAADADADAADADADAAAYAYAYAADADAAAAAYAYAYAADADADDAAAAYADADAYAAAAAAYAAYAAYADADAYAAALAYADADAYAAAAAAYAAYADAAAKEQKIKYRTFSLNLFQEVAAIN